MAPRDHRDVDELNEEIARLQGQIDMYQAQIKTRQSDKREAERLRQAQTDTPQLTRIERADAKMQDALDDPGFQAWRDSRDQPRRRAR